VLQEGYLVVGAAVQEDSSDLAQDGHHRGELFGPSFPVVRFGRCGLSIDALACCGLAGGGDDYQGCEEGPDAVADWRPAP